MQIVPVLALAGLCVILAVVIWAINTPTTRMRTQLARAWQALSNNDQDAAEPQFQAVVEECRERGWRNHVLANALLGLATLWRKQQRRDEAEPTAELALQLARGHYGESEPELIPYLLTNGLLALDAGRSTEAEADLGQALNIWQTRGAMDPMLVAPSATALARLAMDKGEFHTARGLLKLVIDVHRELGNPDMAGILEARMLAGRAAMELDDWDEAEKHLDQAYEIGRGYFGEDHPLFGEILRDEARVHAVQGDRIEAIRLLKEAQTIFDAQTPGTRSIRAGTPLLLGKLYWLEDLVQDAEFWYERGEAELRRAINQVEPLNPRWHSLLAWTLATCPVDSIRNGRDAVEVASHAAKLEGTPTWTTEAALAAALAEVKDFAGANIHIERALDLAPDRERAELTIHQTAYANGHPYRDKFIEPYRSKTASG